MSHFTLRPIVMGLDVNAQGNDIPLSIPFSTYNNGMTLRKRLL